MMNVRCRKAFDVVVLRLLGSPSVIVNCVEVVYVRLVFMFLVVLDIRHSFRGLEWPICCLRCFEYCNDFWSDADY